MIFIIKLNDLYHIGTQRGKPHFFKRTNEHSNQAQDSHSLPWLHIFFSKITAITGQDSNFGPNYNACTSKNLKSSNLVVDFRLNLINKLQINYTKTNTYRFTNIN